MRKPIGLVVPIQIETPEETEVFSVMEQSSVRKEAIRNPTKEAKLVAEVAVLSELVRVLSDRVTELEAKYETSTN
tara:strand:- start:796 stop:1020 length:225 start_codon:yes stop_codon:yes gene_type:complete